MQSAHESPITAVCEGGDDEAGSIPEVLIAIVDLGIDHTHAHLLGSDQAASGLQEIIIKQVIWSG